MIYLGVPIGILLATSGGVLGDILIKQSKLRIRVVRKKDIKGDFYDHPY